MGSGVMRGVRMAWVGLVALAGVAACGGREPESAEGPRRENWIADTQYVRDSLGQDLMIIVRRPAPSLTEVEPRAGSGNPDAPGVVRGLPAREAAALIQGASASVFIIDLRDAETYIRQGALPGAYLIGIGQLESSIEDFHIRTDQTILVYSDDGATARSAAELLASYGFPRVRYLEDSFLQWAVLGLPVEQR